MHRFRLFAPLALPAALLAGCATTPIQGLPAADVTARGETVPVGTAKADAADDPAIWRNAANPAASLIVATDKKSGLYVYDLKGAKKSFVDAGLVNNVDLAVTRFGVIVVASDRNDPLNAKLAIFHLDTATGNLRAVGKVDAGAGEAYGLCLGAAGPDAQELRAFAVIKDGTIREYALGAGAGGATSRLVRTMKVPTQAEGCIADPATDSLYIGEEDAGIWRFALTGTATEGTIIAPIDNQALVADVEGLAIARVSPTKGWLVASSQGDNAYSLFSLPDHKFVGRFRIAAGQFGATSETDGIELITGDFGPDYPGGLFVAQDGDNAPAAQNFKLVAWADIVAALKLDTAE